MALNALNFDVKANGKFKFASRCRVAILRV